MNPVKPLNGSAVQALLFDYDDTLVQTRACKFAAIRAAGHRACGFAPDDEQISMYWGTPYQELFNRLFSHATRDVNSVIAIYESLGDEFPMRAYADSLPTLKRLLATRPVGIVTSAARTVVMPQLKSLGFPTEHFVCIQTAEDTKVHKPDPEVFKPAFTRLANHGISPNAVLYVGDAYTDYLAATRAGLQFIGIPRDEVNRNRLLETGAVLVPSLADLIDLI